jgi:radical SAM superfamily enzyme YgiQ (UPF0313 family)
LKVLFINPNQFREPIGPIPPIAFDYLADPLERAGHELKLVDLCFTADSKLLSLIGDFKPDVTGITLRNIGSISLSIHTNFIERIQAIVRRLKDAGFRNMVVGGAGFTVMPKACFEALEEMDYGVVGEGEVAFVKLLEEIAQGKKRLDTPGVMYRTENGTIIENPREYLDLGKTTAHKRRLVDNRRYYQSAPYVAVQTKRGCPLLCSYCMDPVTYGRKMKGRVRSPSDVADEFEHLESLGIKNVWMADAEFNLPPQHAIDVARELARRKNKVVWYCGMRPIAKTVPEELFDALRAANCQEVMLTIDSVSAKVARANGFAGQTAASVREATDHLRRHGFPIVYICLVGLPEQGHDELKETLDFIASMRPDLALFYTHVRVFPGTPMEKVALQEGLIQADWNPLEPVFYKREFVDEQLVPLIRRYMRTQPDWLLLTENNHLGEIREKMVERFNFRGSHMETYRELKRRRPWVVANVLRLKIRTIMANLLGS